jgi:alpha-glucosidase
MHTLAKELALYVVIYSPLHMVSDLPKNLEANPTALEWIKVVPVDWETTMVPEAEIGDHAVVVRKDRNSGDWYLGGITDEEARSFEIDLNFLESGKTYEAHIWADGEDADWETNPYPLERTTQVVTADDALELNLAAGGGVAVRFVEMD